MAILTISVNLDANMELVEEAADGTLKSTPYLEDFLFKLIQDLEAINAAAGGDVLALDLPTTVLALTQSGGVSPITVDLVSLDGRNLTLTLTDNVLSLTQSQGVSPLTVDLGASLSSFAGLGTWRARTETAPPPASGQIRFNNSDPELATLLFVNETNDAGTDVANFLDLLNAGDVIYIQERTDSDNFILVQISNNIDFGTYRQFGIAAVVQQGTALSQNTQVALVITASGSDFQGSMSSRSFTYSDFMEPPQGFQADGVQIVPASGGFASVPTLPYDFTNHPGVWGLNTGAASAAGRVFVLSEFASTFHVGVGGITRMGFWFQAPAILSVALQRYVIRAGVSSVVLPNSLLQAITFEYQDDENVNWQAICGDALGVETSVDTGVLVVASTYYKLEWEVNSAGTSVEFFIDNVSVATIVTNIPSGVTFGNFVNIHIMKLIGLGNRAPYIDAYYFNQEITR